MMIYPTGEKPMLKDPYYTFYEIFKHQQWNRMVAVGYSFRDDPINIAIMENLEKVEQSTLIVINPEAEKVIKNLGVIGKKYNNRIIRIPEPLSDNDVLFNKLNLAIRVNTWKQYQERLWKEFKEKINL